MGGCKSEVGGCKSEVGGCKLEVRGCNSEMGGCNSEVEGCILEVGGRTGCSREVGEGNAGLDVVYGSDCWFESTLQAASRLEWSFRCNHAL